MDSQQLSDDHLARLISVAAKEGRAPRFFPVGATDYRPLTADELRRGHSYLRSGSGLQDPTLRAIIGDIDPELLRPDPALVHDPAEGTRLFGLLLPKSEGR